MLKVVLRLVATFLTRRTAHNLNDSVHNRPIDQLGY